MDQEKLLYFKGLLEGQLRILIQEAEKQKELLMQEAQRKAQSALQQIKSNIETQTRQEILTLAGRASG